MVTAKEALEGVKRNYKNLLVKEKIGILERIYSEMCNKNENTTITVSHIFYDDTITFLKNEGYSFDVITDKDSLKIKISW